mmetsp:Transcript_17046/g.28789  ORF Transcript_17046/g.28789 Transcript_17046/m.28789 type:complete len:149 (+) Transcript_17046:275-721(+)
MSFKLKEQGLLGTQDLMQDREIGRMVEESTDITQVLQQLQNKELGASDLKGRQNLSGIELKELLRKEEEPLGLEVADKKGQGHLIETEENAEKVDGLGYSKKEHMNSGIYAGLDALVTEKQRAEMNRLEGELGDSKVENMAKLFNGDL